MKDFSVGSCLARFKAQMQCENINAPVDRTSAPPPPPPVKSRLPHGSMPSGWESLSKSESIPREPFDARSDRGEHLYTVRATRQTAETIAYKLATAGCWYPLKLKKRQRSK